MTIADKIKYFRKQNNLTLLDLSKILNVSHEELFKYERDLLTPNIEIISKIASYLNISTEDFILNYGTDKGEKTAKHKIERTLAKIFMILSYSSIFFGLVLWLVVENDPFQTKYLWVFLLMLPFPIISFVFSVLSFRYKDRFVPGMISGIIMSVFYIIIGGFAGIPLALESDEIFVENMQYLDDIEKSGYVNVDFPELGKASVYDEDSIITDNGYLIRHSSIYVYFEEGEELKQFETLIENCWHQNPTREMNLLFDVYTNEDKYFYLHNITNDSQTIELDAKYDINFLFYTYEADSNYLSISYYTLLKKA